MDSINTIKTFIVIIFILLIVIGIVVQTNWFWRLVYPLSYKELILENSNKYDIDPYLLASIIYVESKFSASARSHKGATGLMQIMPKTGYWIAEQLGEENFTEEELLIPEINVRFGSWYLAHLSKEFNGNIIIILASYNAGIGNVKNWLENWDAKEENLVDLPFPETRDYVKKILNAYDYYVKLYSLESN